MADKKQPEFTVTDRRRFTSEAETSTEASQPPAPERPEVTVPPRTSAPLSPEPPKPVPGQESGRAVPPPPTAAEQQAQQDAFNESKKKLDAQLHSTLTGHRPQDFEMTFERFIASLYMSALMQLGLMHEQGGQPQVDLIGARQTIDTIGLLAEKTQGNLTSVEQNLVQNCLYELRMAYVEVTNAITRGPQPGQGPGKSK